MLKTEVCYRAMLSRDKRFEGRFVVAVKTTKIYCRVGCPARIPKLENVIFLPCPAAAEEVGFRPCRRCRPESAARISTWPDTSRTVTRALKLIAEGALDGDGNINILADQLGVTERHLRRLFATHLGASPVSVAQTQRVHLARRLLEETICSVTDIAFSSGFSSIRRFNFVFRKTFGKSPSEIQRRDPSPRSEGVTLNIPFKPPFDWDSIISFLRDRAIPGVESIESHAYRRCIIIDGKACTLEVHPSDRKNCLQIKINAQLPIDLLKVVERVRRVFDLSCDPKQIEDHFRKDRMIFPLVKKWPGLRIPGAWDPFETSIRAILGQQISVRAATTISGRLAERFGTPVDTKLNGLTHLFPTAGELARADLRGIGLPKSRALTIQLFSQAVESKKILLDSTRDINVAIAELCDVPGIGNWTAQYISMRALGEPDAFPAGDLGLRKALAKGKTLSNVTEISAHAESWRPFRSYATMFLWRSLS